MTKTDEVKLLDATIAKFGPHSYLGPWLADNRTSLVADIQNDVVPGAVLPGQAYRAGLDLMTATKAECQRLLDAAKAQAEEIVEKAYRDRQSAREIAARHFEELAGEVRRGYSTRSR